MNSVDVEVRGWQGWCLLLIINLAAFEGALSLVRGLQTIVGWFSG